MAKPVVDGLETQFTGRLSVARVDVTTDDGEAICEKHGIRQIPAFLLMDPRGVVLYRRIGRAPDAVAIEEILHKLGR
jgi:thioredoxin-like negative regulator of GroEL